MLMMVMVGVLVAPSRRPSVSREAEEEGKMENKRRKPLQHFFGPLLRLKLQLQLQLLEAVSLLLVLASSPLRRPSPSAPVPLRHPASALFLLLLHQPYSQEGVQLVVADVSKWKKKKTANLVS